MSSTFTLKLIRQLNGLSQSEMAKKLGVSRITYINYEKQRTKIPAIVFIRFCEICNCNVKEVQLA